MRWQVPFAAFTAAAGVACARKIGARFSQQKWERRHHDGSAVSLLGGFESACGVITSGITQVDTPYGKAHLVAAIASGAAGFIDDHLEDRFPAVGKGFKGHLGALKRGQLTSGMLKIICIGSGAVLSALMLQKAAIGNVKNVQQDAQTAVKNLLITGVDAVIVAGTANFLNLLDLAPGRALKVSLAGSVPAFISENDVAKSLSCGLITTSMLGLAKDLSGEKMLGDLGANALGSVLGVQFADFTKTQLLPKLGIAGVIIGLNFASEKFSFSKVIQENTVLNWIDQLGR